MSILLFLFHLFSVAPSGRFWHSVLPRAHVSLCYIYKFHSVCICPSFSSLRRFSLSYYFMADVICCYNYSRHEKVVAILLPHGRCYMLLHLLNSFCVPHFA